jgi:3'(2'), 5'-bisphosphate nucleotidase
VAEEDSKDLRSPEREGIRSSIVRAASDGLGAPHGDDEILRWIDRGGAEPEKGDLYWTLDPIDGTKGFLRGQQYAVALALIQDGQVLLGVLGCPQVELEGLSGVLLVAARGEGTEIFPLHGDRAPLEVMPTELSDPAEARFCESVEKAHSSHDTAARVAASLGIRTPPLRVDSQVKYAMVAMGRASIYLRLPTRKDYQEKIWDHAAGSLVVTEAGGRVTDMDGLPLNFRHGRLLSANRGIVATNGRIHDQVLQAVALAQEEK